MRFARIIEFKTDQLLISITTDSDVDGFVLSLETYHQGSFIRTGLPFATFEEASQAMDELSQDKAEQIYQAFAAITSNPSTVTLKKGAAGAVEGFEKWIEKKHSNQT